MTNFAQVAAMNVAFGNPKGDPTNIDFNRVRKQCLNIPDEVGELFIALGADPEKVKHAVGLLKYVAKEAVNPVDLDQVRDSLSDIHVFTYGGHHLMGIDADCDMNAVIEGVMTRFVKNTHDMVATIKIHADKGVTDTYVEGDFPTAILKSGSDQPDAPKGKFLKSASYKEPVFYPIHKSARQDKNESTAWAK